jgi:hypothetical protein
MATSEDIDVATREDFFMATDSCESLKKDRRQAGLVAAFVEKRWTASRM